MTTTSQHRDIELLLEAWLGPGGDRLSETVLAEALGRIETVGQTRQRWGLPAAFGSVGRLAAATAVVVVVASLAFGVAMHSVTRVAAPSPITASPGVPASAVPASPLPSLSQVHRSERQGYQMRYPAILALTPATADWTYGAGITVLDPWADRYATADGRFSVWVESTRLPRPMTAEEWAADYAAMPSSGIPTEYDAGCPERAWSDITIGDRAGRLFEHECFPLFAMTTVGDRGYVFVGFVNTVENQGTWVPLFKEMLSSVEFTEEQGQP
jgi:hypothetical protein